MKKGAAPEESFLRSILKLKFGRKNFKPMFYDSYGKVEKY